MSDALEVAANAFDAAMGNAPTSRSNDSKPSGRPTEMLFGDLGAFVEGGDDEPAGGDSEPDPKPRKAKEPVQQDDDDDLEVLYDENGEPIVPDDMGDDEDAEDDDDKKGDEEDDEDAELMSRKVMVVVDGEEKEVSIDEAIKGYIRTDTFHQRLNKVAELQNAVAETAHEVVQSRTKYVGLLAEAEEIIAGIMPAEPDWDKLYAENPAQARELEKQYKGFKDRVEQIKATRLKAEQDAAAEDARQTAKFAQDEYPKFARAANWKSKEDAVKDTQSMRRTALQTGFTEKELAEVYDSRMLTVLLKASKYDRMMAARPKPVNKNGKIAQITPGAGRDRTAPKGMNKAQNRLRQTGSVEDAASVFSQIISKGR